MKVEVVPILDRGQKTQDGLVPVGLQFLVHEEIVL